MHQFLGDVVSAISAICQLLTLLLLWRFTNTKKRH
jgi:hypothetical protein